MKAKIQQELKNLAKLRDMTILYACESGSRAWGFGSPDSDYDIRFIYVKPTDWYLSIDQHTDSIDLPVDADNFDFSGWELRKLLRLYRKSNAAIFEWLQSPVMYHEKDHFRDRLWALRDEYFMVKTSVHHYLGIAKNMFYSEAESYRMKIKKYFYILRPLFAAMWVVKHNNTPPMEFHILREVLKPYPKIDLLVENLLQLKLKANESDYTPIMPELQTFIIHQFEVCMEQIKEHPSHFPDGDHLNTFFRTIIQENDY